MTTQSELVKTFLQFQNTPSTASNMRIITMGGGSRGWLIGGRNGREMVIAEREPLNEVTVYANQWSGRTVSRMSNRAGINQVRRVKRIARLIADDVSAQVTVDTEASVTSVREVPELEYNDSYIEVAERPHIEA